MALLRTIRRTLSQGGQGTHGKDSELKRVLNAIATDLNELKAEVNALGGNVTYADYDVEDA